MEKNNDTEKKKRIKKMGREKKKGGGGGGGGRDGKAGGVGYWSIHSNSNGHTKKSPLLSSTSTAGGPHKKPIHCSMHVD